MRLLLKLVIDSLVGIPKIDRYLRARYSKPKEKGFPSGHFHSPISDFSDVNCNDAWFDPENTIGGDVDLNEKVQLDMLNKIIEYYPDFPWASGLKENLRFHLGNGFFAEADALALYTIIRRYRPERVVEVGSGYSSALMLDTKDNLSISPIEFTFIDPFPERLASLLSEEDRKAVTVIEDKVQNVPLISFEGLEENDILFIDSSHVSKIGSDVNFLLFSVLPLLKKGVLIHFHDIFWPFEYPKEWVLAGWAWNEIYILRAFLQFNSAFSIVLFNSYIGYRYKNILSKSAPLFLDNTGGSIWLRKN